MANITLLQYNNYFNRIIKKEASYAAYLSASSGNQAYTNINFNPGDSVRTSIILGTSSLNMSFDYLLVHHTENNTIVIDSRWFIMDENRTRDGQYEIGLKRDVIVDNYSKVIAAPIFLEKGWISSTTNSLLYNKESMTYNQIKNLEVPLKDVTGCGWVVGYIPQDAFKESTQITKIVAKSVSSGFIPVNTLAEWDYYDAVTDNPNGHLWSEYASVAPALYFRTKYWNSPDYSPETPTFEYTMRTKVTSDSVATTRVTNVSYSSWSNVVYHTLNMPEITYSLFNDLYRYVRDTKGIQWDAVAEIANQYGIKFDKPVAQKQTAAINALQALDGNILKDLSTNSFYKIELISLGPASGGQELPVSSQDAQVLISSVNEAVADYARTLPSDKQVIGSHDNKSIRLTSTNPAFQVKLTQLTESLKLNLDSARNHVLDAPYDIFCIPYSDTKQIRTSLGYTTCRKDVAIGIAEAIAAQAGSGSVYDTQLLPYCPSQELIGANPSSSGESATFDLRSLSISIIKSESGTQKGAIVWCTSNTRSFDISDAAAVITASSDPVERKVENECDMYRVCSGNYQGVFEFSAAKSYGVTQYHVDCTFKPFTPYIHLTPKLGGLYGGSYSSFNDARGLICGGDFSLTQLSNAWANYELQNKNYQNIFDRQIQNMNVNNAIVNQEAGWNIAAGIVGGGVGGAMTGASVGGGYGAIAGAVIGTATSAIGGAMDYANLQKRQEEAKSYATDMYGYQLGNIQALPTSIGRNSALTANTKIFPFLERYSCTATEKTALRNKLTYDGMTVMTITTLNAQISETQHFFRGKIIRLNNLGADNHMAQAIYEELNKGVYI